MNAQQRAELAKEFAAELVKRYKVAADVCIHKPSKDGDERNYHVHILTTTRSVSVSTDGNFTPTLGSKTVLELSDTKRRALGLGRVNDELKEIRQTWAELANKALQRAGRQEQGQNGCASKTPFGTSGFGVSQRVNDRRSGGNCVRMF